TDAALLAKPSVKAVVDAMPKGEDEAFTARAAKLRDAMAPCSSMPLAFAKSQTESGPINEREVMADKLPKALTECKCNVTDWDVTEYSILHIAGAFAPTAKWIDMPKLAAGDKRTVADLAK